MKQDKRKVIVEWENNVNRKEKDNERKEKEIK